MNKMIFAIPTAAPAMPPKPSKAVINAMIKRGDNHIQHDARSIPRRASSARSLDRGQAIAIALKEVRNIEIRK